MGNQANCQNFCDNEQQQRIQQIELRMAEYPLQCQICKKQIQHINFNKHLDITHFANIQQQNGIIAVRCLLCNKVSERLQSHEKHLTDQHPYTPTLSLINYQTQNITNKMLKSKLKEIEGFSKLKLVDKINNQTNIVEYERQIYKVQITQKQYDGMEYDEVEVFSELVLFPVYQKYRAQAKYYFIEKNALQRTIKCKSYILCQRK